MDKVAIVAHFDPNDSVETNILDLLVCLSTTFDRTVLVTTSKIEPDLVEGFPNLTVITRPNFGYDFYSYRVGLTFALENWQIGSALLVNSSFAILSRDTFCNALRRMLELIDSHDVVGATESLQFSWHIQSYLMLLGPCILEQAWFRAFLGSIEPTSSKFDTIARFELGLSVGLKRNNAKVTTLLRPDLVKLGSADDYWVHDSEEKYVAAQSSVSNVHSLPQKFNPVHHLAGLIARQLGYVKFEVLRDNPHKVDLSFVDKLCEPSRLGEMQEMVGRSRLNYNRGTDNLSALKSDSGPIPSFKLARWRRTNAGGVGVAVVLHLYYAEMIPDIYRFLKNIVLPFDLHVTTPFEGDATEIFSIFSKLAQSVSIYCSENRGRDIGPFVSIYRSGVLDRYDAVLKMHSKKSTYSTNGSFWRDRLYQSVAGDSLTVLRSVDLIKSGKVGIVGPHRYYLSNDRFWGANRETMRRLLSEMAAVDSGEDLELGFFAGSMFWFAPRALEPLKDIPEASLTFEHEDGQQDGTLAHAIERIFCQVARSQGFTSSSVILGGSDIRGHSSVDNDVPVL
ncbi:rhamnan synthesis F family protein [Mesorhizobium sp. WSM3864]|uniref:rhamnan synthesis F family protein n=1 Tax=Mesorhizobium sp. WSM3864 TaxID=2029404 RepID=UPI001482F2D1|nr:rhamnan synthesis F family protein [Mesorhizobium sp. WSM3864]